MGRIVSERIVSERHIHAWSIVVHEQVPIRVVHEHCGPLLYMNRCPFAVVPHPRCL